MPSLNYSRPIITMYRMYVTEKEWGLSWSRILYLSLNFFTQFSTVYLQNPSLIIVVTEILDTVHYHRFKKSTTFRSDLPPSSGGTGKGIYNIVYDYTNIITARPCVLSYNWYHKTRPPKEYRHQVQTKIIQISELESESQFTFLCTRLKVPEVL
jgi:hypothetical protein